MKAQYDSSEGLYMLFFVRDGDSVIYPYGFFMRVQDVRVSPDGTKLKGDWMLQNLVWSGGLTSVRGYDNVVTVPSYNYLLPFLYELSQDWYYDTGQAPQGMVQTWTSPAFTVSRDPDTFEGMHDVLLDYTYEAVSSASTLRMRLLTRNSHDTGWNYNSVRSIDLEGTPNIDSNLAQIYGNTVDFPTIKTAHIPTTPEASRYNQIMLYNPGSLSNQTTKDAGTSNPEAKLRIHNIRATVRPWSGRRPY